MSTQNIPSQVLSSEVLDFGKVRLVMEAVGENAYPEKIGYYESVGELVEKIRSSKHWDQGEIFVYAKSPDDYVIAKQVAPSSCEMMIVTKHGVWDVVTAYRFEQDELVQAVQQQMNQAEKQFHRLAFAYPTSEAAESFGHSLDGCYFIEYNDGIKIPFAKLTEAMGHINEKGTTPHFWSLDNPAHRHRLSDQQREVINA